MSKSVSQSTVIKLRLHKGYIFFDTFYVIESFDPCATLAEQLAGVIKSQMGLKLF